MRNKFRESNQIVQWINKTKNSIQDFQATYSTMPFNKISRFKKAFL